MHLHSLTFDCADPPTLARFWAEVTGYEVGQANPYFADLRGDGRVARRFMFIKVPEQKVAKNRVHLDLGAEDLEAEIDRVIALGARLVDRHAEYGVTWASLQDPEGNEFCIGLHPPRPPERPAA